MGNVFFFLILQFTPRVDYHGRVLRFANSTDDDDCKSSKAGLKATLTNTTIKEGQLFHIFDGFKLGYSSVGVRLGLIVSNLARRRPARDHDCTRRRAAQQFPAILREGVERCFVCESSGQWTRPAFGVESTEQHAWVFVSSVSACIRGLVVGLD